MKEEHYFLFLLSCCSLSMVSPLHSSYFERTKAEDNDGSYPSSDLNIPSSCDMTSELCDINCCSDQDCSEQEKRSFKCSTKEHKDNNKFSYLDCDNLGSLDFLGNPLLCLHDQNSPYLGDFYEQDENISSNSFSEILSARNRDISSFRIINMLENNFKNTYKHGSNIFFVDATGQYHNIDVFSNVLSKGNGYCSKEPLRFKIDKTSACLFTMDEEQCLLNKEFHLQHHLNIFKTLELLGDINDVKISYNIVCLKDETDFLSFHEHVLHKKEGKNMSLFDITECESYAVTEVNENKTTCKNVVVGLNYTIFVNGTLLRSINVTVFTVNIPINIKVPNSLGKRALDPLPVAKKSVIHTLQKTSVIFQDIDFVDNVKKHGYVLGKPVHLRS